jgi:hypothetical protein
MFGGESREMTLEVDDAILPFCGYQGPLSSYFFTHD